MKLKRGVWPGRSSPGPNKQGWSSVWSLERSFWGKRCEICVLRPLNERQLWASPRTPTSLDQAVASPCLWGSFAQTVPNWAHDQLAVAEPDALDPWPS